MKNYMKFFAILAIATVFSCQKENLEPVEEQDAEKEEPVAVVPDEILDKLDELAYNSKGVLPVELPSADGTAEEGYLVEGDMFMTRDQIMNGDIFANDGGIQSEQYRDRNLVSTPNTGVRVRIITVLGYTGKLYNAGLSALNQRALREAINDFNRLNLRLRFSLIFTNNLSTKHDIRVLRNRSNKHGDFFATSKSPFRGNPGNVIALFMDHNSDKFGLLQGGQKHLMLHHLGHAIGMRHTDWTTTWSYCKSGWRTGQLVPPGLANNHIRIPNTVENDPNSVFNSCVAIRSNVRTFSANDRRALRFLY